MNPQLYWHVHHLAFALEKQLEEALRAEANIGFAQYKVLEAVGRNTHAKQNSVAAMLNQTEAGVSRQIKILVKKNMLHVGTVMNNRRARELSLTESGEETLLRCATVVQLTQQTLLQPLDLQEQKIFSHLLAKLLA